MGEGTFLSPSSLSTRNRGYKPPLSWRPTPIANQTERTHPLGAYATLELYLPRSSQGSDTGFGPEEGVMPDRSATKILFRWKVSLTPEGNLFARCDELELSTFAPSPKELDECIRDSMTLLFEELAESGELDSYLESRGQGTVDLDGLSGSGQDNSACPDSGRGDAIPGSGPRRRWSHAGPFSLRYGSLAAGTNARRPVYSCTVRQVPER